MHVQREVIISAYVKAYMMKLDFFLRGNRLA
jgi:hypothetical protein